MPGGYPNALPDDLATLKAMVLARDAQLDQLLIERGTQTAALSTRTTSGTS